jgi:hypothetical protein
MAQWLHRGRRDRYGGNGRLVVRPELLTVSSRLAKLRKSIKIMTLWRLYSYETLLGRCSHYHYYLCLGHQHYERDGRRVEGTWAVRAPVQPATIQG